MLDLLEGTRKFAGAAGARALFPGRGFLAHHIRVQRTRALDRKLVSFFPARLIRHDVYDLGDHVSGTLNDKRIADTQIASAAQRLTVPADTHDVVFVVQSNVL